MDPIARILDKYPSAFFQSLVEQMDAAFAKALRVTRQQFDEPEQPAMLGQTRHACCEEGFRTAAQDAGLIASASQTQPAGGRYSLVSHENVHLIRGNVQTHCGPPRPTQFRSSWASLNSWLDPLQLDLLRPILAPSPDHLCGMVVVTANKRDGDASIPAFVGIGVPRSDLSEWVILEPIQKLLGRYHDLETKRHTPREAPVEVKDRAMPRLKKRPSNAPTNTDPDNGP